MNIGVFDSGLGGLAILRNFVRLLPSYNYVYLGDSQNVPYGEKTPDEIYHLTCRAIRFLKEEKNCRLIVLACNTASTVLPRIQQEFLPSYDPQFKVLGIIRPAAESIIESAHQPVGMMATDATVNSNSFIHELDKLEAKPVFYQQGCPALVPYIEAGKIDDGALQQSISTYVNILKIKGAHSLLLGCTHYELIADLIQKVARIPVITEGEVTAKKLRDYLEKHPEIETKLTKNKKCHCYFTHLNDSYSNLVKMFLKDIRQVSIEPVKITS